MNEEDAAWVSNEISRMTPEEKIGQLFCLIAYSSDEGYLKELVEKYKPGGIMILPMPLEGRYCVC